MIFVIDTNVVVSGLFFHGTPRRILDAWRLGIFDLAVCGGILAEYASVLHRIRQERPSVDVDPFIDYVMDVAYFCDFDEHVSPITADPDDDVFMACALAARADGVVSGDRHLLEVNGWRDMRVFSPAAFTLRYLDGPPSNG